MKYRKPTFLLVAATIAVTSLAGCTSNSENQAATKNGVTTIEFWTAPNPSQQTYWKETARNFEKGHPNIKINVSALKESPTSEASIQSALIGKAAPTISENINRGFAAQLAESKALVPLDELKGINKAIESRQMTKTVENWKFADGHQYVFPVYSNPMLFGWRLDVLKELGYSEPPKTYDEVYTLVDKLKQKYPDKYLWAKPDLADPTAWKRWFDFFMLYNAASDGNKFIKGNKYVADKKAATEVLTFMSTLQQKKAILTKQVSDPFETKVGIFTDLGPWTFTYWAEKFPKMKYEQNYTLSRPPVPNGADTKNAETFADSKGLVIFAQATKSQRKAAVEFINWVYSNPENDMKWLNKTQLPPARDDLGTNPTFKTFFKNNPTLQPYAEAVQDAIPAIDNASFNELQTYIGQYAVNPIVRGDTKNVRQAYKEMENAIKGDLR